MNSSSSSLSKHLPSVSQFRLAGFCVAAFMASLVLGCTDKRDVDNTQRSDAATQSNDQYNEHGNEGEGETEGEGMGINHGRGHGNEGMDTMHRSGRNHSRGMGMMDKEKWR